VSRAHALEAEGISGHARKRGRGLGQKTIALRAAIVDVFATFDGAMSARQVYYQLVSRGAVPNTGPAYGTVQRLLVEMRRDESVDYDRVVDRTRGKHHRLGWDGVADIMAHMSEGYRRDLWASQGVHVHVACEKQALEGVFADVVDQYGGPLWVLRGFSSESFLYEWAEEIKKLNEANIEVVIAYFGDHDPSGLDIERDTQERLHEHGAVFEWERYGLLWKDFDEYSLINVDVKTTDTRSRPYLETYGNRAAELDALPPDVLRQRIEHAIETYIDADEWHRLQRAEALESESLTLVSKNWTAAVEAARGAA
jgi:hypothetical protein